MLPGGGKEKGGKNPLPTAATVDSGAMGAPWAIWAERHLPHGWFPRCASSLGFGSHVAIPPVWKQQLAKQVSSEASAEPVYKTKGSHLNSLASLIA